MDHKTDYSNIPDFILQKIGKNLHNKIDHPIEIIKQHIYKYFDSLSDYKFPKFDTINPIVSVADNFDKLLIPKDHPARRKTDTYYVNENTVLRTHTSAHQAELLKQKYTCFLVTGDVYRKDEIDQFHYPVFHQMEGVAQTTKDPAKELIKVLSGLIEYLFPKCEYRVKDDYFPFTHPSFEIEVKYKDKWLEVLGCGVVQPQIITDAGLTGDFWAFGLGLERLALVLFEIPDIRYIWSDHPKFLDQFSNITSKFHPYSLLPSITKDISFWIPEENWADENNFFQLLRNIGCEWIESVELKDKFYHKKQQQHSRMYRIKYSPSDPSLKDPSDFTILVNQLHSKIRDQLEILPGLKVR
jgi:phenylalanyl-tRNA synthetase alpha chain